MFDRDIPIDESSRVKPLPIDFAAPRFARSHRWGMGANGWTMGILLGSAEAIGKSHGITLGQRPLAGCNQGTRSFCRISAFQADNGRCSSAQGFLRGGELPG
jgi:hypothetical protein